MSNVKIDWPKVLLAAAGVAGGWFAPRVYRAVRNLSKTEQKLAEEELQAAMKRAEDAHANADPNDDVAADVAVTRAKAMRAKAARLAALADAFSDPSSDGGVLK